MVCAAACGEVDRSGPVDAPGTPDADVPRTYRGTTDQVPPVTFGGMPYCMYTITLKQLEIELGLLSSGQPTTGRVQNLNVEAVIPSTVPNCPPTLEVIPPNIAVYNFESAMPGTGGTTITFKGAAGNQPPADLTVELSSVGSAFQARLGFHRNNQPPPLDWSVIATVSLSALPP